MKLSAFCMKVYGVIESQVSEGAVELAERRPDQRKRAVTLHVENRTFRLAQ